MSVSGPLDWHAYFWPGTTVLRNKLGIKDPEELREVEHRTVETRAREIQNASHQVDRTLDANHLKSIHAHLFGDLYDWAGQYRMVNISKTSSSGTTHHFGDHASMDMYMRQVRRMITEVPWTGLERPELASAATFLHPHGLRLDSQPLAQIYRDIIV